MENELTLSVIGNEAAQEGFQESAKEIGTHQESFSEASQSMAESVVEKTNDFFELCRSFFNWNNLFKIVGAVIIFFIMWAIYKVIKKTLKKVPEEKINAQNMKIIQKTVKFVFKVFCGMYVLSLFGVNLNAVWGAAGIAGIAIGFAAQTSVSNLISGIFVLSEKTMKIGDFISVGGENGTVDSVGLLSVKIHTLDNHMIRIPNSTIINSNFMNKSYYSKRRMNFDVSIDYDSDMKTALEALNKVPSFCPTVLQEPAPSAWFCGFGESGINMTLAVWFESDLLLQTRNDVFIAIKKCFDESDVKIPFNRLDVSLVDEKSLSV